MNRLQRILDHQCGPDGLPGAVAAVARDQDVRLALAGHRAVDGEPMTRDTVFRIASLTKPIVAVATLVLRERGVLALDDPVARWLPELASPQVLREPGAALTDTVPAERPITVRHLLTFAAGHGLTSDFSSAVTGVLMERLHQGPPDPQGPPPPDEWLARLAEIPMVHQPGEGWTYNTGADVLGVLLARAVGTSLGDVLADTVFTPLGMRDTGFSLSAEQQSRAASSYRRVADAEGVARLTLVDAPDGAWSSPAIFESGAGGLVSTVDDLLAFGRMLAAGGVHGATTDGEGARLLPADAVAELMNPHVQDDQPNVFLDGQAWGYGGSVDVADTHEWNVPGRYGWVGGSGTALYVYPDSGLVAVWLTQLELGGPGEPPAMGLFLTDAAITARGPA